MPATRPPPGPSDGDRIHDLANSFKKALDQSASVELEQFLPPREERVRAGALAELVKVELAYRWENGRGVLLEHFLAKFPELGAAKDLPAALLYEEYRVRHEYGDTPPLSAYRARFPEQFPALERLVRERPVAGLEATHRPGATAAPAPALLTAGCFVEFGGGYTLLARIGAGTFGEVWHARSAGGGFEVAIKIIFRSTDHQDVQRELQALEVVRGLRHPFLLSTQSFWFLAERLYIVMELADLSLAQRLQQCERQKLAGIPKAELLSYLRESAEALDYLHSKAVMHRDIKPENILLLQGHIKVADFGLARIQDNLRSATATTTGTPLYMPPEVWEGQISPHSDQYSLAMSYIHLRLGTRPYPSNNYLEVMRCHLQRTPELGNLPDAEKRAILRAVAKDPHQRFPSCLDFTRAIEEALGLAQSAVIETPAPSPPARPAPPAARPSSPSSQGDYGTLRPPRTEPSLPVQTPTHAPAPAPTQRPDPRPDRRWRAAVAVLGLLFMLPAAYAAWHWFGTESGAPSALTLAVPESVRVRAGEAVTFALGLGGVHAQGPVRLVCNNLPPDLKLEPGDLTIPSEARAVQVRLTAAEGARPRTVTLALDGPGSSAALAVTILPLATLPAGCTRAEDAAVVTARNGLRYYSRIHYPLADGTPIPFVLIRMAREDDPATFYIMQDKVSNGLFGKFARAAREATGPGLIGTLAAAPNAPLRGAVLAVARTVAQADWKRGGWVDRPVGGQVEMQDLGATDPDLPVLRVTAVEAHRFARWLGGLLPSAREWDKAAGRFDREEPGHPLRQGPFRGAWDKVATGGKIAVGRKLLGPMRLKDDTLDVSPFGCRHMSGNGKEWTNTLLEPLGGTVSEYAGKDFPAGGLGMLRGRTYRASRPLFFDRLEEDPGPEVGARAPQEASPEIGFRVVLHP